MAEIKTGIFAKNVQKRLNRAQEKVRADEADSEAGGVLMGGERQRTDRGGLGREAGGRLRACGAAQSDVLSRLLIKIMLIVYCIL